MEKTDCIGYKNKSNCSILNKKNCNKCKFYKNYEQYDAEIEKSIKLCEEKGIYTYENFFKSYKRMKKIREMKGAENNESINRISK